MTDLLQKFLIWTRPLADWKADKELFEQKTPFDLRIIKHVPMTENFYEETYNIPAEFEYAVFSSGKAFTHVLKNPAAVKKLRQCKKIFCVGKKTAEVGQNNMLTQTVYPQVAGGGESLCAFIIDTLNDSIERARFWLPRGSEVAFDLLPNLQKKGGQCVATVVYGTRILPFTLQEFKPLQQLVFAFTSTLSARSFLKVINSTQSIDLSKTIACFIGDSTAVVLKEIPFKKTFTLTKNPSMEIFLQGIFAEFFKK